MQTDHAIFSSQNTPVFLDWRSITPVLTVVRVNQLYTDILPVVG